VDVSGGLRTELEIDDQPSGLGWLPDGRLLVVAMHRRQVLRVDPDGVSVHADLSAIATFHTNDMVVDRQGRAYVGNFGFELDQALKAPLLELLSRATVGQQVLFLTNDEDVTSWARVEAIAGNLALIESVATPDPASVHEHQAVDLR
jgi:sugar lactone lactonase YvrE